MPTVAVIDIGSNSIKLLVATRSADGRRIAKKLQTLDARISTGLSAEKPKLGAEGMARGVAAVCVRVRENEVVRMPGDSGLDLRHSRPRGGGGPDHADSS